MSLDRIIKNLDITKIKAPSGLTYGQELVEAANLLSNCIQSKIHQRTMQHSISTADLADIKVEGNRMSITLKIQNLRFMTKRGALQNALKKQGHQFTQKALQRALFSLQKAAGNICCQL